MKRKLDEIEQDKKERVEESIFLIRSVNKYYVVVGLQRE